jgi:hypothetical protein
MAMAAKPAESQGDQLPIKLDNPPEPRRRSLTFREKYSAWSRQVASVERDRELRPFADRHRSRPVVIGG